MDTCVCCQINFTIFPILVRLLKTSKLARKAPRWEPLAGNRIHARQYKPEALSEYERKVNMSNHSRLQFLWYTPLFRLESLLVRVGIFSYSKGLLSLIRRHFTASGMTASESATKSAMSILTRSFSSPVAS